MKGTVLIIILTIFIPLCALAMEPGDGDTEGMEPGCGDTEWENSEDIDPTPKIGGCAYTFLGCGEWTYSFFNDGPIPSLRERTCSAVYSDCKKHTYREVQRYIPGQGWT